MNAEISEEELLRHVATLYETGRPVTLSYADTKRLSQLAEMPLEIARSPYISLSVSVVASLVKAASERLLVQAIERRRPLLEKSFAETFKVRK